MTLHGPRRGRGAGGQLGLACRRVDLLAPRRSPSRIAQTTSEAPRTISPAAKTPAMPLIMLSMVDLDGAPAGQGQLRRGTEHAPPRSSGSKPSALIADIGTATCRKLEPSIGCGRTGGRSASGTPRCILSARTDLGDASPRRGTLRVRGQPDEFDALLLGMKRLRVGSRAYSGGRAGTGNLTERAPWRTAVRTQSIAVSPPPIDDHVLASRHRGSPSSKAGAESPRPTCGWP